MSQTMTSRSTSGFSEQMPLDKASGSMGMTRRGKYTLVPRSIASASRAESGRYIVAHVGDCHEQTPSAPRALGGAQVGGHAKYRVVEVAGVFAVYRDEGNVAQIDARPAYSPSRTWSGIFWT
ncbi:hypothetical protein CDEF62S_00471 [Castellaniella defragrans]